MDKNPSYCSNSSHDLEVTSIKGKTMKTDTDFSKTFKNLQFGLGLVIIGGILTIFATIGKQVTQHNNIVCGHLQEITEKGVVIMVTKERVDNYWVTKTYKGDANSIVAASNDSVCLKPSILKRTERTPLTIEELHIYGVH